MVFAVFAVTWTARCPKLTSRSGRFSAQLASVPKPRCPVSVPTVANPRVSTDRGPANCSAWFCTLPTYPPPPPIRNRPFQWSGVGSRSSKRISVSMVPRTRQCAGSVAVAGISETSSRTKPLKDVEARSPQDWGGAGAPPAMAAQGSASARTGGASTRTGADASAAMPTTEALRSVNLVILLRCRMRGAAATGRQWTKPPGTRAAMHPR